MDKPAYMKDWWASNKERRKEYEKKRAAKRTPEQREALKAYLKQYRADRLEESRAKDRARYPARKEAPATQARTSRVENTAYELWKGAKNRARRNSLAFNLEVTDIRVPEFCPALGIPLFVGTGFSTPNSPTIDRIHPHKGYVKGNICVISHRANFIKTDATVGELRRVLAYAELMTNGPP